MNRFVWLIRREIWEHRAIWAAPLIVLACLALAVITGNVHLGPIGSMDTATSLGTVPYEKQVKLLLIAYAGLAFLFTLVMWIIGFFYSLDSLYSDRRDRSVLFWKSLPLSDAETVLSKFAVASVVIPVVALLGALLAQLLVAGGGSAMLEMGGVSGSIMWQPTALLGGAAVAAIWCATAILWNTPVIAYLLLASAWAPKSPFLWAVLPPVALSVLEVVLLRTTHVKDFVSERLFGLFQMLGWRQQGVGSESTTIHISDIHLAGNLKEFYTSPELWLGVAAAGLLLAAAIWVRRYRDETT